MPLSRSLRFRRFAIVFAVVLLVAVVARFARAAADIEVQLNSFPSAQGWTYFSNGIAAPETPTWALSGGVLSYNTMAYLTNTSRTPRERGPRRSTARPAWSR